MNIPWKLKSRLFGIIDAFHVYPLLYFAQKHITGRSRVEIVEPDDDWKFHKANIEKLGAPAVLEFGAGKSLAQNLYLSGSAGRQVVVDLFPMFDPGLADDAARAISAFGLPYHPISSAADLAQYRISYQAPLDIARSGFGESSFDCCISTNTLEHLPRETITAAFRELRRVLRNGGIVSAVIDYSDHYSHTDRSIGPLEFLRYDAAEYSEHNHPSHFQNRLRHHDFEAIFREAGFRCVRSEPLEIAEPPARIAAEFDGSKATTFATKGLFVLANDKQPARDGSELRPTP